MKLFIAPGTTGIPLAPWFSTTTTTHLFTKDLPANYFDTAADTVSAVDEAEAIILPHNVKEMTPAAQEYIHHWASEGERLHVPVFVFCIGDLTDGVRFDERVYVFRFSVYKSTMGQRDIVIPTSTEDPPASLVYDREKHSIPVVAFCGMGAFKNAKDWVKYFLKNLWFSLIGIIHPNAQAYKLGVYWRRAMMQACRGSALVQTNFIVRRTFSSLRKTIELDPAVARQEYLEATSHADFVLAPKGDGNYSNRFLKTLAFGRIPVLVDTDVVLPLEDTIPYEKIVVKIPMSQASKTPTYVRSFYDALTDHEWIERQQLARQMYNTYLRQDAFFAYFFKHIAPTLKP